jgi:hypothetical protein
MSIHRLTHDDMSLFRAERGWTAVSIEICPHDPVTILTPDAELEGGLREFQRTVIAKADWSDPADYAGLRRAMAERLVPAAAELDEVQIVNCAVVAIWCALHHPRDGGLMRTRMMLIKQRGLAPHFTICRGLKGAYGTCLGEGYTDMRGELGERIDPSQTVIAVVR